MSACVTYTIPGGNTNVSDMYNPRKTSLHPEFSIHIKNDTTANLLVRVMRDEILFSRANAENKLKGGLTIHCRVYSDRENLLVFDSLTVTRDVAYSKNQVVVSVVKLRIQPGKFHNVQVRVRDQKRLKAYKGYTFIDNTNNYQGQRYYSTLFSQKKKNYSSRGAMNFYPWLPDSFNVKIHKLDNAEEVSYLSAYTSVFGLPILPYLDEKDSLSLFADKTERIHKEVVILSEPAFYFFHSDTVGGLGVGILKAPPHYPNLKTSSELIEPLAYLCNKEEFAKLKDSPNKKLAVDEFWMASARDYTKAKQLIRVYYNRAKYANIYFTSYTEGWRTDRGMIFVLLGPPEKVFRDAQGERWVYGGGKYRLIEFYFTRIENPYSPNHYVLSRKTDYRSVWRSALKSWRNGRIYNAEEPLHAKVYADSREIK